MEWFHVDKEGLRKVLERRGKEFVALELVQNAWDEDVQRVDVTLSSIEGRRGRAELVVRDDDPDGFVELSHAWTLFAESEKKSDPEKRGRFNLGEKLVLALCEKAEITTTTGRVIFSEKGRTHGRKRTDEGSVFEGVVLMTKPEVEKTVEALRTLLPPEGVSTYINGVLLNRRERLSEFEATLATEISGDEGLLRPTRRKTIIEVYEVNEGEEATLYEMGIPVVPTGDRWHINILQKVPLNMDRDNVTPSYLQNVRALVVNEMADNLSDEDSAEGWVTDAISHRDASPDAVKRVIEKRFGKKTVIFDPSDPESNKRAASEGYAVVHGGTLPGKAWENIKKHNIIRPASKVTPSSSPYSDDPNAKPVKVYDKDEWTDGMRRVHDYTERVVKAALGFTIDIRFVLGPIHWSACFGGRRLDYNVRSLGKAWFKKVSREKLDDLIIHELGHHYCGDHLSSEYYKALTRIGSKFITAALEDPELFEL